MTMRLGLDFDNTLVSYDKLFHSVARQHQWIPEGIPVSKIAVRDHLRATGREADWTRLQGEVYGGRILEANPFEGMLAALQTLTRQGVAMRIISHKTRTPLLGEFCDLHAAARSWLTRHGFYDDAVLGPSGDAVFFEVTKEAKVARILSEQCTHYVDDLPEILHELPPHLEKIHFSPGGAGGTHSSWRVMRTWHELPVLLGMS